MPRVFIPEPNNRYDCSTAESYGTVVPLIDNATPFSPETVMVDFSVAFNQFEFNPTEDFICLSGQTIAVALLLTTAVAKYGKIKVLMFDARSSTYIQRNIDKEFLTLEQKGIGR